MQFHRVRSRNKFHARGTTRHRQLLGLSLQDFQKMPQNIGIEHCWTWLMRKFCKNVPSRPTSLFWRFCWNDSACSLFPAFTTQLFFQSLYSYTLCSFFESVSTTNNLCNFWRSKFQHVGTYVFCSWDELFTQKLNCGLPNNLCKCVESPLTLSRCPPVPLLKGISTCLEATIL